MLKQTIFAILMVMASSALVASTPARAAGEIDVSLKLKVDGIVTLNGGGAQIYFDQNHQCSSNRANVSATAQNRDHLISMLITAQTSGKLVNLDLRSAQGGSCNGGAVLSAICVWETPILSASSVGEVVDRTLNLDS